MVPFNKPFLVGCEMDYVSRTIKNGKLSGNGHFTKNCQSFFEDRYEYRKCFLTTSCTDALEMAAILLDIQTGDEVIVPSFTFVSTANAFLLRGAEIKFADSLPNHPNIDPKEIEKLISPKTKAIVVVHYAGIACDMDTIMDLANKHSLFVVEDAAQAIDSFYKDKALGSIGNLAAFSFHETKNISCGEGGMLVVNDEQFVERAEIIWEKGTNRAAFWRGEVDKYNWVDVGSSFLPSELTAAFLWAQLQKIDEIQGRRLAVWNGYSDGLKDFNELASPFLPEGSSQNGHMYYLVCSSGDKRNELIEYLNAKNIHAVFHYITLHDSPYFKARYMGDELPNAKRFSDCLVRLPFYYELTDSDQTRIIHEIKEFYD